jgi:hypothetical protein
MTVESFLVVLLVVNLWYAAPWLVHSQLAIFLARTIWSGSFDIWFVTFSVENITVKPSCPKMLGNKVLSGSRRKIYTDPQGRQRLLGRSLYQK